jgi:hypothetical protein
LILLEYQVNRNKWMATIANKNLRENPTRLKVLRLHQETHFHA